MEKPKIIKEFNYILETLLSQLSPLIGTTYHHYFKKLVRINSILPIQQFSNNVLPFKSKIMNEDESYFSNSDSDIYKNEVINQYKIKQETKLQEILRLTDIYYKLDLNSKKEVWSYFKALIILCEDYTKI